MMPAALRTRLLANGQKAATGNAVDPYPVVKIFTPDANATWLLTEIDPHEPDRAFGFCALGLGEPELGYVSLSELASLRGRFELPVPFPRSQAAFRIHGRCPRSRPHRRLRPTASSSCLWH